MSRVLVIDDDDNVLQTIRLVLERVGHTVSLLLNGEEALQCYASFRPDLVITDIVMPGKEGIATIIELRKHSSQLPILAISGSVEYLKFAQRLGATRVILKPFDPDDFVAAVAALLANADSV